MRHARTLAIAIPLILTAAFYGVLYGGGATSSSTERPNAGVRSVRHEAPAPSLVGGVDASMEAQSIGDINGLVVAYLDGVHREQVRLEEERLAAERAAQARARVTAPSMSRSYAGVGDCTGFSIPDYIIQRESGGNPYAVNSSSGAFGCGQVMPMHWNGGGCGDLDRYNIDDQRECVRRLSRDGTNLQPWAATR